MYRFYYPEKIKNKEITITDSCEVHHIKNVLRFKEGDKINVFNNSQEVSGKIIKLSSQEIKISIISNLKINTDFKHFILACAIPKKGKFEVIVEKATELGVSEIYPLLTKRTEVKLAGDRLDKKLKRYQTIAINASKQSQRNTVPKVHLPQTLEKTFTSLPENVSILIPSLQEVRKNIFETLKPIESQKSFALFIGPEGDFTPKEYELAAQKGALPVSLGKNILRVETAAISALSCLYAFFSKD